jgi:outer membrane lipoprotein-sorting protein
MRRRPEIDTSPPKCGQIERLSRDHREKAGGMNARTLPFRTHIARFARAGIAALVMTGGAALALPALHGQAAAQTASAQRIADHFSRVKTMMGEFVQFGPDGEQTGGKFYIQRPGKVLFLYEEPSNIRVVSDGSTVVVNNKKLDTWDTYPLAKTPLKLVLGDEIDLGGNRVKKVEEKSDLTTVVMEDRQVFGDSRITMMFDPQNHDLRQWTIRDAKGKDTTVMIFNVKEGVTFGPKTFHIDYQRIKEARGE